MCLYKLKRLHQTEGFFHTAAHWEVIDTQVLDNTIRINNEEASAQNFYSLVLIGLEPTTLISILLHL